VQPDAWKMLVRCVEEGVRHGVHRAYKHSTHDPPDEAAIEWIAQGVLDEIAEWFTFPVRERET
jgi:hypothetical protein